MRRQEEIRKEILLQLYAQRPLALGSFRIHRDAMKSGYDFTQGEIDQELDFLAGEKLIVLVPGVGSSELRYKLSSDGVKHYEQNFAA